MTIKIVGNRFPEVGIFGWIGEIETVTSGVV
ncbi:MAG: hypothetical protein UU37_C0001G0046 [Candidatus Gottesmanbacteria bacterium GW2011_GWA2_41_12]|uniref:Uncharacterized protein n=1 Tax=Candidatus Gottesmanbacteria bacterium GW2011_GWA2_41_12 TaxID=1618440 RepID=A0A0G0XLU7_9BACT|nr:MAG: hypothetical protein UU37_C0001G0046 [Candidatus Gottesmanbacteria bacterium GW2011_GWA2_41_12]